MPMIIRPDVLSHFLSYFAYTFNLYYPWIAWLGSELNSWLLSHSTNQQGDPRAFKLEGSHFWLIVSKVEGSHSFYITTFIWRDLITASKWRDLILFIYILSGFTFTCTYHILIYSCMNRLYMLMSRLIHILLPKNPVA